MKSISKKQVEHRLSNPHAYENMLSGSKHYVQVASNKNIATARAIVAELHAMGYLARMVPVTCKTVLWGQCIDPVQRKMYTIYAGRSSASKSVQYIDPRYLHEGRSTRPRRKHPRKLPEIEEPGEPEEKS